MTSAVAAALAGAFEALRIVIEPSRLDDGWVTSLSCRLVPQSGGTPIDVRFNDVSELSIRQTSSNFAITPQIVSLEDRGWDSAQFRLTDPGNGSVEFDFKSAEIVQES